MPTITTYGVDGMTCGHCAQAVTAEITRLPGAQAVLVDLVANSVSVEWSYRAGARVLGICAGSRMLGASGILDGLNATSHWSRISALEASNPAVTWVRGQRYVQDGWVTTTGGVTSGISGTLKVLADLAGSAEAIRVGALINYPGWSLDAPVAMPAQSFAVGDLSVLANNAFPWARPAIDVQLDDGVGETDAAALLEVYSYSQAATANALSTTGVIPTRHGLMIRTVATGAPTHKVLIPGQVVSRSGLHGFDAAFEQLSRSAPAAVVASVAKMLEYPLDRVEQDAAPLPMQWRPGFLITLTLLLAIAAGATPWIIRRARRRSRPGELAAILRRPSIAARREQDANHGRSDQPNLDPQHRHVDRGFALVLIALLAGVGCLLAPYTIQSVK